MRRDLTNDKVAERSRILDAEAIERIAGGRVGNQVLLSAAVHICVHTCTMKVRVKVCMQSKCKMWLGRRQRKGLVQYLQRWQLFSKSNR